MLFQKPQPTPAQLREARNMLADLERLLEAGKENAYALVIREVLSGGDVELQRWLTSGDFWVDWDL